MTSIRSNPAVSNAILKGLAEGARTNTISNTEWSAIKRTALEQIKHSGNPKTTFATVKRSLQMGVKASHRDLKKRVDDFVEKDLARALKARLADLKKNPSVRSWAGHNTYGGRS